MRMKTEIDFFKGVWIIAIFALVAITAVVFAEDKKEDKKKKKAKTEKVDTTKTFKRLHYEQMIIQDDLKNKKAELDSLINLKREKK